jgi:hypothetical protein
MRSWVQFILFVLLLLSPWLFGLHVTIIIAALWLFMAMMTYMHGCGNPNCTICGGNWKEPHNIQDPIADEIQKTNAMIEHEFEPSIEAINEMLRREKNDHH